jgi:transcription antitermination factor NusG
MGNLDQQFRKVIEEDEQARLVALSGVAQRRGLSRYGGNESNTLAPDRGQWRALQCAPRQERHIVAELKGKKFDAYCPALWMRERHGRGKTREIERPMFPGYAFVRCLPEHISVVKGVCGSGSQRRNVMVLGVVIPHRLRRVKVDIGDLSKQAIDAVRLAEDTHLDRLIRISEQGVDEIRREEACHATADGRKQLRWNFSEGEQVRIKTGPFALFCATICGEVDDNGRIAALVSIFGRSSVTEFDADQLEKI